MESFITERNLIPGYPDACVRSRVLAQRGAYFTVWRTSVHVPDHKRYAVLKSHGDPVVFSLVSSFSAESNALKEMKYRA